MQSEIISQTVKDSGQYSHYIWTVVGAFITASGFLLKSIGSYIYSKWVCMSKDITNIKETLKLQDQEIDQLRDIVTEMRIENRNSTSDTNKRIDDILRRKE
jgi:hypothetical protein